MSSNPTQTAKSYLNSMPLAKWGAILGSVVASFCLALMFPLLYLFIDLLASQGRVPTYTSVPAHSQQHFREEWINALSQDAEIAERLLQIRPVPPDRKSTRLNSSHPRLSRMPSSA